jgi:UPF0176 protein
MNYKALLFYKYTTIDNPTELMERERAVCNVLDIKGRIIIAEEGINANIEGTNEAIEKYITHLRSDQRFKKVEIKESVGTGKMFPRLSIKVRPELVGHKFPPHIDARKKAGKYVMPHEMKKWYESNTDFVVVDMRNDFETAVGKFKNSVDMGLKASRDLKETVDELKQVVPTNKKVVAVCTGGVKCEKMSAYLLDQGYTDVYQLHNGIQGYMQKYPGEDFLGALYTYDGRVTIDFGGNREIIGTCEHCGKKAETFENCSNDECARHFIICDSCREAAGTVFCNDTCKQTAVRVTVRAR